ncbi:hypothetical protein LG047_15790 [Methylocystis sp. WRRC1]|uniref:hypothetical protein n=1 Tax=Methylocystis sp. WRRC1 TaxID=1732014 RepID=UPI001D144A8A|nr:hypothetical protein [Methylocystis sp. WRRC1]MCC3246761.1 hypothetical protein [Methylocystis sp. WRRC1]
MNQGNRKGMFDDLIPSQRAKAQPRDDWDELIARYGRKDLAAASQQGDDWDELIRQHGRAATTGMFDDLIPPQSAKQPNTRPGMFDHLPDLPNPSNGAHAGRGLFDHLPDIQSADDFENSPEGRQLAAELRTKADRMLLDHAGHTAASPAYAALSSAANAALLNIPRNVAAAARTLTKPGAGSFEQEYSYLRDIDEAAARQNQAASFGGALVGAVTGAAALPVAPAVSLVGRMAQGAALGAGYGGLSELADTKDPAKALQSAAIGGVIGGVAAPIAEKIVTAPINAVGRVASKVRGTAPVIPTKEEIKASSQAAYDAADQAGLIVKPQGVQTLWNDTKAMLANEGYHPSNQPKLSNFINELQNLQSGNVTLKGLETTRKMLRAARTDTDAETRRLGAMAAERFDDFLTNLKPSDVLMGDAKGGVAALKEARSLWSSYRKADLVDEALQAAKMRAASTGSGGNVDNAIRQEFRKILQNKKKSQSFTDAEKAALARIVTGTQGQNTLRLLGKLSPQGNGLMMALHVIGGVSSGGASVPLAALGAGIKALADRATPANVERLSKIIRARGLNIDPQDLINQQASERLRSFFSSIGVNVEKMMQNEQA